MFNIIKVIFVFFFTGSISAQIILPEDFEAEKIVSFGLGGELGFAILDENRFIVISQFGKIEVVSKDRRTRIYDLSDSLIVDRESGLLGIAIDPDFPSEPYIYLFYSHTDSSNRVSKFEISGDLNDLESHNLSVLFETEKILISLPFESDIHHSGTLRFAKDKTLYISFGDNRKEILVQNLTTYNGKILRIKRDGSVPEDNPEFPEEPNGKKAEIFAIGFRNPFRFSIDRVGLLFIGDVGSHILEELNISTGGDNFGWPRFEGDSLRAPQNELIPPEPKFPIFAYNKPPSRSVIALVAYHSNGKDRFPPEFIDTYFYADFFSDVEPIYYLKFVEGKWQRNEFLFGISRPVDATIDRDGSLYILDRSKAIYKITYLRNPVHVDRYEKEKNIDFINYPNPFNSVTNIFYRVTFSGFVTLKVYNITGELVETLINEVKQIGNYSVKFDASKLSTSIYFYRLQIDGRLLKTNKMLYIK
ncbi:MAG: PQQ-dependent sugar dehydrogenase [Ignavibacteria bacterium]|nr:PQQ-dependent sugar dehydrogenase [Ignavibacteria bacterium]